MKFIFTYIYIYIYYIIDLRFWFLVFRFQIPDTGFRIPDAPFQTTIFASASGTAPQHACARRCSRWWLGSPLQQMVALLL